MLVKKISFKVVLLILIYTVDTHVGVSQFYNTGSASLKVKWKILKTENFSLVFPAENQSSGIRFSNYLASTMLKNGEWYDSSRPKPIQIIMYNQNVLSNAYVTLAPRRMELISTPPQDIYPHDWLEQLALHEYKHVVQLHTLKQGFTKSLSWLTGDIGNGVPVAFVPLWFIEGDAVLFETSVSSTGRGREPNFMKGIKAIELQRSKRYTYDQAYLGTYKGYVPDHYSYGYQMVSWTNLNYGNKAFNSTLKNVAKKPFTLAPFYFGLKKSTGLSKVNIYDSTCTYLKKLWIEEKPERSTSTISNQVPTQYRSDFCSYRFAYIDSNDSLISLRTSIDDNAKFVKIKNGKEEVLINIGYFNGIQVGYSDRYIAWEDLSYNVRWQQVNYSNIRIYDRKTKNSFLLQRKSRHFSPSISKDEKQIAVINNSPDYLSSIEIFEIESRTMQNSFMHPDSLQLSCNSWIDNENIALVVLEKSGKSIYQLNIKNGEWKKLYGPTNYNISSLNAYNSEILFTHTIDGSKNIYRLDLNNGSVVRLTNSEIAADYGTLNNERQLFYSDYDYTGYKLKSIGSASSNSTKLEEIIPYRHEFADTFSRIINFNAQDSVFKPTKYTIGKYSRIKHAVNLHSWLVPVYIDVLNLESINSPGELVDNTNLGFSIFSQNLLSTFTSSLGYYYKDGYSHFRPIIKYEGTLPVITFDMDWGGKQQYIQYFDTTINNHPINNTNMRLALDVHIPFNFSTSRKILTIRTGYNFSFHNLTAVSNHNHEDYPLIDSLTGVYYYNNVLTSNIYSSFYLASRKSTRDIHPKWGISLYLSMLNARKTIPYKEIFESNIAIANIYTPGIWRHHSLKFVLASENGLRERLSLPKGYTAKDIDVPWIHSSQKLSVEYTLPLFYPDLSIGPLAYFKRVHFSGKFDYMRFKGSEFLINAQKQIFKKYSLGFDLGVETHFFRFFWPVTPVFSLSYLPKENKTVPGFYLSTSYIF